LGTKKIAPGYCSEDDCDTTAIPPQFRITSRLRAQRVLYCKAELIYPYAVTGIPVASYLNVPQLNRRNIVQRAAPGMYSPNGFSLVKALVFRMLQHSNPLSYRLSPAAGSLKERLGGLLVPDLCL